MSDVYSNPGAVPQPQQRDQQDPRAGLLEGWNSWLSNPMNRAAMLQAGLTLMQPMGFGQTAIGQIGQAIGSAGEAQDRLVAQQLAQRKQDTSETEAASKQDLRSSQAQLSEARAGAAADRATMAGNMLDAKQQLSRLNALTRLQSTYAATVAKIREENAKNEVLQGKAFRPAAIPTWDEWLAQNKDLSGALDVQRGALPETSMESPPPAYPDAKRAPDGNWYVQRNGKYFKVQQ